MNTIFEYKDPEQQREYQRNWMAARRNAFFHDKCCVQCGSTENLELDHIDRNEKEDHNVWSWSEERRQKELAKCQVLCYDCHLEKTRKENQRDICKNGHPFTDENTQYRKEGWKRCRTCRRIESSKYRNKIKHK